MSIPCKSAKCCMWINMPKIANETMNLFMSNKCIRYKIRVYM